MANPVLKAALRAGSLKSENERRGEAAKVPRDASVAWKAAEGAPSSFSQFKPNFTLNLNAML